MHCPFRIFEVDSYFYILKVNFFFYTSFSSGDAQGCLVMIYTWVLGSCEFISDLKFRRLNVGMH